ncbi:MAG: polyprenyl diphosphate synthase, partial [Alphaproteobacteria bacterium]
MAIKPFWRKRSTPVPNGPAADHAASTAKCAHPTDDGFMQAAQPGDPRHIAVIMDGNGRWAQQRHLPRKVGHREGAEALRRLVEACLDRGIPYLTVYAFSLENWSRSDEEISDLMDLLRRFMAKDLRELEDRGVRGRVIGDRTRLDQDIQDKIVEAEARTAHLQAITVTMAVSYGGRQEVVAAAKALAHDVASGKLSPDEVDEAAFAAHLETPHLPDPDLLIRTSGEQRISNFLLWQSAYTEFAFLDVLWPDFNAQWLDQAIEIYHA